MTNEARWASRDVPIPRRRSDSSRPWQSQSNPQSPNPWEMTARLDLSGKMHYNKLTQESVPVPHIHGPGIPGGVRPARPAEVPYGW